MQPLTMITNNNNTYTWVTFLSIPIFLFFKQFFSVWSNGGIDDISFSKNKKKVIVYCWSTRKFDIRNKRVVSHCITFTFVLVITLWQNRLSRWFRIEWLCTKTTSIFFLQKQSKLVKFIIFFSGTNASYIKIHSIIS